MRSISPSTVQAWVTEATAGGLSPRSLGKYHVMLHGIFKRAVRDRVILHNPCADTELPKVPPRKVRILTPEEFERLLAEIPDRFRALVLTDIETGMRWGELVALRPRHVDFLRRLIAIEETVVEVSKKNSPTGERMVFKAYPKDNEFRTLRVSQDLLDSLAARIASMGLDRDDLLFPSTQTKGPIPLSRNTFRTRYWLPALEGDAMHSTLHLRVTMFIDAHSTTLKADRIAAAHHISSRQLNVWTDARRRLVAVPVVIHPRLDRARNQLTDLGPQMGHRRRHRACLRVLGHESLQPSVPRGVRGNLRESGTGTAACWPDRETEEVPRRRADPSRRCLRRRNIARGPHRRARLAQRRIRCSQSAGTTPAGPGTGWSSGWCAGGASSGPAL
jgi:integrase